MAIARDMEARPQPYAGVQMRSKLEMNAAQHMDRLGVPWAYELPVVIDGRRIRYLPDFLVATSWRLRSKRSASITATSTEGLMFLELGGDHAHWVEVKPQSFLYRLRDQLNVAERTNSSVSVTARELCDAGVEELWKPKRLAEMSGRRVLVVGDVDRTRTLSVTMTPDAIEFRTDHPFVNFRNAVKKRQDERERREWQRQWEQRQAEREAERQRREEERRAAEAELWRERINRIRPALRTWARGAASYGGQCECCRSYYGPADLSIYRGTGRYILVCHTCEERASVA